MNENSYILSVCIRTYNQKSYVKDALDSVLDQETSFPFEIIVSDDCSTDGTRAVLLDYQKKWPERIKLILRDEDIGGPMNLKLVIESSDAKYITCLDGDDYYTDEYKLQKQVDFLEAHPEFVGCFHNVMNVVEATGEQSPFLPSDFPSVITAEDIILKRWFMPIHSVMMRRELIAFPDWYSEVMNDDYVVNLSVAMHGPYHYMPDIMAAYRHHQTNISLQYQNIILIDSQLKRILEGFSSIYPESYKPVFEQRIKQYEEEIRFHEAEARHPWRKWLRFKTYKRKLKRMLKMRKA